LAQSPTVTRTFHATPVGVTNTNAELGSFFHTISSTYDAPVYGSKFNALAGSNCSAHPVTYTCSFVYSTSITAPDAASDVNTFSAAD